MTVLRLTGTKLRNLHDFDIQPGERFNLIYGFNGSGKTSLLEAIHLLGLGRSFRSHLLNRAIAYSDSRFTVFGSIFSPELPTPLGVGIEKSRTTKMILKIAGEKATSAVELAKILPLQLINPDSYKLLTSGPRGRREFLDWGVFHVEPQFFPVWQRFQRVLKQRNAALQEKSPLKYLQVWDNEFINSAYQLSALRKSYLDKLLPVLNELLQALIQLPALSIDFSPGWDDKRDLVEVLAANYGRDTLLGYTQAGPQRADISLKVNGLPVQDVLSRGEQKILVCALKMAQGVLLEQLTGKKCVYLLDDLAAELDINRRSKMIGLLEGLNSQVFITAVEKEAFSDLLNSPTLKLFHVEQGTIQSG